MIIIILQVFLLFLLPILIIRYSNFFITKWIGTIGTAYLLGIIIACIVYLVNVFGVSFHLNSDVGEIGSFIAIAIAIPLLLFSSNLLETKKLSSNVLKSFGTLTLSAMLVTTVIFYLYGKNVDFGAELSGMAIGLYTGGTPNLNAIGSIFQLDKDVIALANLSDMVIGAVFYLFLLLLAKPLLSKILRSSDDEVYAKKQLDASNVDDLNITEFSISWNLLKILFLALGMTVIGAVIGIVVWMIMGAEDGRMNDFLVPTLMITVTVLGIIGSFNKGVRETKGMNVSGQYFILVFSLGLASSLDFSMFEGVFVNLIILYGAITIGVFVVHISLSKLLNIDVDCAIVTLTAGVYGPAFVPAITKQIKNEKLTAPGLIIGSIGYAIGTFLGMGLGYLFML